MRREVKYLVMFDNNTDEEVNRIELERVDSIAIFKGTELNKNVWLYGLHADPITNYLVVQYDNSNGFMAGQEHEVYFRFE